MASETSIRHDGTTTTATPTSIKIVEKDITGHVTRTYVMTTTTTSAISTSAANAIGTNSNLEQQIRLDLIPETISTSTSSIDTPQEPQSRIYQWSPRNFITTVLLPIFLPHGYPHTVTEDYTPYQIYDSLQAFASSIAGLLSSRAVLQSFGFDDGKSASSTATYATLLSIVQATISNLSTILFANYASSRIAPEVKFYRFLADIVNDAAFVFDCLSPLLPSYLRVPVLCLSSAFRAVCGVAGGSSKAVLSAHFAKDGNIGELNAKDGSQETVINLMGMWVGGVVVSRVDGVQATWLWLFSLLALHLWWNYSAVWHVRLRVLNRARADIVMRGLVERELCPDVNEANQKEGVLGWRSLLTQNNGRLWKISIASDFAEFARTLRIESRTGSGTLVGPPDVLPRLFSLFEHEEYLLWFNPENKHVMLMMKENAVVVDQLKSWCHAARVCYSYNRTGMEKSQSITQLSHVQKTLEINTQLWDKNQFAITQAGWSTSSCMLEMTPGKRLHIN